LLSRIFQLFRRGKKKIFHISALPLELLYNLLNYIPAKEITNLCLTNNHMRLKIRYYLHSSHFAQCFCETVATTLKRNPERDKFYEETFVEFGRLIRVCFDLNGMHRQNRQACISLLINFYKKCDHKVHLEYYGWGMLFLQVMKSWSQSDEYTFMRLFFECSGVKELANQIFQSSDRLTADELTLRRLLRGTFLDVVETHTHAYRFHLSAILHLICQIDTEYRLIMLLGAAINTEPDGIQFIDYAGIHIEFIENLNAAQAVLGEMPMMVAQLANTQQLDQNELRWSDLRVFNFIETLTTYPEPWIIPNFASFLVCAPSLARLAIVTRALYDNVSEAGSTLFNCVETALHLNLNAFAMLRPTVQGLVSTCPTEVCLAVFREAFVSANQHTLEFLSPGVLEVDVSVRESLEINGTLIEIGKSIFG